MQIVKIPKRRGEYRTIYIPDPEMRDDLRAMVSKIARKAVNSAPENVIHGFARGKSPVTNATAHVGHRFTLVMDLRNFFDSVTPKMLSGRLSKEEVEKVFVDGAPRQGLPTSPAVANLAAASMDKAIVKGFGKRKWDVVYTRYADDLSFSFDDAELAEPLRTFVEQTVKRCGFTTHPDKTELMDSRHGRRKITGVAVDAHGVHPTRKMKRRLRAAIHQKNENQANGLAEWCRCKLPRQRPMNVMGVVIDNVEDEINAVGKIWRIKISKKQIAAIPLRDTTIISDDVVITGDPIYVIGMSTLTTGWRSCMTHPSGSHRAGVKHWLLNRGTRIAALLSKKTVDVGGVIRRRMRARALVHELREGGGLFYDRVYGNPDDIGILRTALEAAGVKPLSDAPKEAKIVGHIPCKLVSGKRPYLDTLRWYSARTKDKQSVYVLRTR